VLEKVDERSNVMDEYSKAAKAFARSQVWKHSPKVCNRSDDSNPLRALFNAHRTGPGIWKWDHYFDVYHRHFSRFRGQEVHILEIGVFGGGSLTLWKDYFGPKAHVYGVDIDPACKTRENGAARIFVGDQADRAFWGGFRKEVPTLDIVIDDGGHLPHQQIASLEELLPHLRFGGVYSCEDVHREGNPYALYVSGLADMLNVAEQMILNPGDPDRRAANATLPFQSLIESIALYPFVTIIEKRLTPIAEFLAPRHGTQWPTP
jgi:hypothetical protein